MKTCSFCGHKHFREIVADYLYRRDGRMMLFKDVPCEECTYCGERYYKAPILKEVERVFDGVASRKIKPARTLQVPVLPYAS